MKLIRLLILTLLIYPVMLSCTEWWESDFEFNVNQYQYSMSINCSLEIDGDELDNANGVLGAFVGYEIRGIAKGSDESILYYGDPWYYYAIHLIIYSNVYAGENITFKY